MKRLYLLIVAAATIIAFTVPAQADLISSWVGYFTSDHMTGGAGTAPFGEVDLTQAGTSVDFHVVLYDGSKFMVSGAGGGYNFLFNGTGVSLGELSGSGLSFASGPIHADGTGDWNFGVVFTGQGTGGANALPGPIDFTVANASILDVTGGNGNSIFAADIISGQTGNTGDVDVSSGGPPRNPVPEPATMLLLGAGLIGLAGYGRKKLN